MAAVIDIATVVSLLRCFATHLPPLLLLAAYCCWPWGAAACCSVLLVLLLAAAAAAAAACFCSRLQVPAALPLPALPDQPDSDETLHNAADDERPPPPSFAAAPRPPLRRRLGPAAACCLSVAGLAPPLALPSLALPRTSAPAPPIPSPPPLPPSQSAHCCTHVVLERFPACCTARPFLAATEAIVPEPGANPQGASPNAERRRSPAVGSLGAYAASLARTHLICRLSTAYLLRGASPFHRFSPGIAPRAVWRSLALARPPGYAERRTSLLRVTLRRPPVAGVPVV